MDTTPYWLDPKPDDRFGPLTRSITVDALVVGAGIAGVTTAYLLRRAGLSVALLDRGRIGRVDTGHTTAHLTAVTDLRLHELVENFGRDHARAVWDAGAAAIDQIEEIAAREKIECEFTRVPGYLHAPVAEGGEVDREKFREDARLANEFGFEAAFLESVPQMERPGVRFSDQAKFHPLKYVSGLARLIPGANSDVYSESAAEEFDEKKRRARVNGHWVNYGLVILATHNPLTGEAGMLSGMAFQTKLALYTSYAVGARVPRGTIPAASFWDTNDPYLYLRIDRRRDGDDYAILGGEDHKTGQTEDTVERYRRLEETLLRLAPKAIVDHRWSGQVIETNDGSALYRRNQPGAICRDRLRRERDDFRHSHRHDGGGLGGAEEESLARSLRAGAQETERRRLGLPEGKCRLSLLPAQDPPRSAGRRFSGGAESG